MTDQNVKQQHLLAKERSRDAILNRFYILLEPTESLDQSPRYRIRRALYNASWSPLGGTHWFNDAVGQAIMESLEPNQNA
jgi:hypothetical protein